MAHTNSTTNYGLPQFITTDKPAWLTDVNTAYADIDLAMKNNADTATTASNNAIQALSDAGAAATAAATADAKGAGAIASISDIFDATATYAINSVVIYNNLLYICTVAVTVPGAWTGSANWDRITVEDLLNTKANTSAIPTKTSDITNDSGYLTLGDVPCRRASTSWGTSLNVNFFRNHYVIMLSDYFYSVWLAGDNDVIIRNVCANTRAGSTGSATLDSLTVVRTASGISVTTSTNFSISVIG